MNDLYLTLMLLSFIPMVIMSVFLFLCFHRIGYSGLGACLVVGFSLVTLSGLFGLIATSGQLGQIGDIDSVRIISLLTRVVGWCIVTYGFILWFLEIDKNVP